MNERHGTQYALIAVGTADERCEDADLDVVLRAARESLPFWVVPLRGAMADRLSALLALHAQFEAIWQAVRDGIEAESG